MISSNPTFVRTAPFVRRWEDAGLDAADAARLEAQLAGNPEAGKAVGGTGRLRKLRFAPEGRGKRGAARVCYALFGKHDTVLLYTVYLKSEKEDLTDAEANAAAKYLKAYGDELDAAAERKAAEEKAAAKKGKKKGGR